MRPAILAVVALSGLPGFGQSPAERPRFEIADIHPSVRAMNPFTFVSGGVLRGDRYSLDKATMLDLIRVAYDVPSETVLGGPNWLEFDRWDINAKAPAGSTPAMVRRMLQSLLIDRFQLAIRNDMRPVPAYALSGSDKQSKLIQSQGTDEPACRYLPQPAGSTTDNYSCRNMSMAAFADRLRSMGSEYLKDPVIDATGFEGAWDFDLQWTRRSAVLPGGMERVTLFDAVERQLGLKLAPREAAAPVLVIDRVSRPTSNAPGTAQKLPPREPAFDVASVKLNRTAVAGSFHVTRGGLDVTAAPLKTLLGFAWDINTVHTSDWFIGLPKGIDSVYVDIDAKTPQQTRGSAIGDFSSFDDDLRAMTRALLVERFRMQWHYENRPMEAYSILPGKPKLKKADPQNRASCHEAHRMENDPRDSNPLLAELLSCRNVTIAQFASRLQQIDDNQFAYPVEDATGIEGTWDFDLSFSPSWLLERSSGQTAVKAGADASEPDGAVTLAEAIGKQLGLRLEKRKRVLPAVVIDHMELKPIEN